MGSAAADWRSGRRQQQRRQQQRRWRQRQQQAAAAAMAAKRQERCAPGPLLDRRLNVLLLHSDYDFAPHTTTKRDRLCFYSVPVQPTQDPALSLFRLATDLLALQVASSNNRPFLARPQPASLQDLARAHQPTPYARCAAVQRHAHGGRGVHLFPTQFCKLQCTFCRDKPCDSSAMRNQSSPATLRGGGIAGLMRMALASTECSLSGFESDGCRPMRPGNVQQASAEGQKGGWYAGKRAEITVMFHFLERPLLQATTPRLRARLKPPCASTCAHSKIKRASPPPAGRRRHSPTGPAGQPWPSSAALSDRLTGARPTRWCEPCTSAATPRPPHSWRSLGGGLAGSTRIMWASSSRKLRGMAGQQLVAGFLAGACFVTLLLLLSSDGCRGPGAA